MEGAGTLLMLPPEKPPLKPRSPRPRPRPPPQYLPPSAGFRNSLMLTDCYTRRKQESANQYIKMTKQLTENQKLEKFAQGFAVKMKIAFHASLTLHIWHGHCFPRGNSSSPARKCFSLMHQSLQVEFTIQNLRIDGNAVGCVAYYATFNTCLFLIKQMLRVRLIMPHVEPGRTVLMEYLLGIYFVFFFLNFEASSDFRNTNHKRMQRTYPHNQFKTRRLPKNLSKKDETLY